MHLDVKQKADQANLSLYWNDDLVYHGSDDNISVDVDAVDGINCLIIECERQTALKNFQKITIEEFKIDGTDSWPVQAAHRVINIPFSLLHGYFYTESGNDYLSDRAVYTNSYQKIFFVVRDGKIVDYYHDRGPEDLDLEKNFHSEKHLTKKTYDWFHMVWSDVYLGYVHRLVYQDHCLFYIDPKSTDTYSRRWLGPVLESTATALEENLARSSSEHFPNGSDFLSDGGFKAWPFYHVFGSYFNRPMPKETFDHLLKIV